MAKKENATEVTLRSMMIEERFIDTIRLTAKVADVPVTITKVLNNTAVYYHTGKPGKMFLESLEKVIVRKDDIVYLPIREPAFPKNKPANKNKK